MQTSENGRPPTSPFSAFKVAPSPMVDAYLRNASQQLCDALEENSNPAAEERTTHRPDNTSSVATDEQQTEDSSQPRSSDAQARGVNEGTGGLHT